MARDIAKREPARTFRDLYAIISRRTAQHGAQVETFRASRKHLDDRQTDGLGQIAYPRLIQPGAVAQALSAAPLNEEVIFRVDIAGAQPDPLPRQQPST